MATQWIDLLDPGQADLRAHLPPSIHPRALDQLLEPAYPGSEPRPTLEGHGDYVFGVFLVAVAVPEEDRVFYQEIDLVLTADAVLTVRKTPPGAAAFDPRPARESWAASTQPTAGMAAYALVDEVAERFLDLVDSFDGEIDELEDHVAEWPAAVVRERLSRLRHDLLHVRRTLTPTRDAVRRVVDGRIDAEGLDLFPREVELSFADAYDKLLRATEMLELSRDLVAGVRDYHQSKIATDQNEVVKRLTVVASILLLPTFIVGLYGQNFRHVPELDWAFGYWWSWAWILGTTAAQLAFFRWRRWI